MPEGYRQAKSLARSWEEGWQEAGLEIRTPEPVVRLPVVHVQVRATAAVFWPQGEPMPTHYKRQRALPCQSCRRVRLDDGGQAVVTERTDPVLNVARLRCKACGAPQKLPILDI